MEEPVRGEDEDATVAVLGKRGSDVAGYRAEPVQDLNGLGRTVYRDALDTIVGRGPDSAGGVFEKTRECAHHASLLFR